MTAPAVATILADIDAQLSRLAHRDVPSVRAVRRAASRALADAAPAVVLAVADALVRRGSWPDRLIAYELVAGHRPAFAALTAARLVRWSGGLADWGTVDLFGCTLGGQAWRSGLLTDAAIDGWARSPDRWRRRLALVCTVPLNSKARGGTGDPARTLRVCDALASDRDDMVVKALSWALRELAKRDPAAVRGFLARHGDRLAARVRREVVSKLTTGLKTRGGGGGGG
ncbi:MAG TPA: DNA alkylation repair protein, partial [Gemmataceae bacterium]